MKKAIIVLAHQMPEQLNILLEQLLCDAETEVFVHVNKRNESIIPRIMRDRRIHISQNNIAIHWGSDEILTATLNMFREVLADHGGFAYVLVISGQDLLVRKGLDAFLTAHKGEVFIDLCNKPTAASIDYFNRYVKARVLYRWPEIFRRRYDFRYHPVRVLRAVRFRLFVKEFPFGKKRVDYPTENMRFSKDFYWCALPVEVVRYILTFIEEHPAYMSVYKGAYQPEEGFISTLIINAGFGDKVFQNGVCQSLTFTHAMENNHAPVLTTQDIAMIEASGRFFARKFDLHTDAGVIDYFRKKITEGGKSD